MNSPLMTPRLERAFRRAAFWHRGQTRKASDVPYIQHPAAVAMILDRLGCDEDVVIAGLLHDAVEDAGATFGEIAEEFGEGVAAIVRDLSERKLDDDGRPRPWAERKREHLDRLAKAPLHSRAVALADKLHNLVSIRLDLQTAADRSAFWGRFNAPREDSLRQYHAFLDAVGRGDPLLERLADECRRVLAEVEALI
jgi:(p)ppGpp synthase/HD superfamily hydrolase